MIWVHAFRSWLRKARPYDLEPEWVNAYKLAFRAGYRAGYRDGSYQ